MIIKVEVDLSDFYSEEEQGLLKDGVANLLLNNG